MKCEFDFRKYINIFLQLLSGRDRSSMKNLQRKTQEHTSLNGGYMVSHEANFDLLSKVSIILWGLVRRERIEYFIFSAQRYCQTI